MAKYYVLDKRFVAGEPEPKDLEPVEPLSGPCGTRRRWLLTALLVAAALVVAEVAYAAFNVLAAEDQFRTSSLLGNLYDLVRPRSVATPVDTAVFASLQQLALVNAASYCVPTPGISNPFECESVCGFLPTFELVTTFTADGLSTSCSGYIALDHDATAPRILVVFRGSHSIADALADIDLVQTSYVAAATASDVGGVGCAGCVVHEGFYKSYMEASPVVLETVANLTAAYPDYTLVSTGHSLGGAVAVLFGVDAHGRGWAPQVVTFGEPRVGNGAFADYVDATFAGGVLQRVTHLHDPVPRVPVGLGYRHHGGELYITKGPLEPGASDIVVCDGQESAACSAGEGVIRVLEVLRAHLEYFVTLGFCSALLA
ncbi:lipase precursor [Dipodascopsis tothii]|uniref:lipase precursor n=1 Tax=Dipodascopsis tothii TaxID=44089 RepID=UPI0034D01CC3